MLEVLYHLAKFGWARISSAAGRPKMLSFLFVCLLPAALREAQGAGI